jgi:broad specificity phosphatase PhoE
MASSLSSSSSELSSPGTSTYTSLVSINNTSESNTTSSSFAPDVTMVNPSTRIQDVAMNENTTITTSTTTTTTTTTTQDRNSNNDTTINIDEDDDSDDRNPYLTVRFFWVRHGETIANHRGWVVGQWDSPLTDLGRHQATLLGQSAMVQETLFWRRYSSDLGRTQETAYWLSFPPPPHQSSGVVDPQTAVNGLIQSGWTLDGRVREIAKGARQEYPKSWDYERAVEDRKKLGREIPKLETTHEAWERIADFISHVVEGALDENDPRSIIQTNGSRNSEVDETKLDIGIDPDDAVHDHTDRIVVNVLVVTHAGTLRTLLKKMVPHAHPSLGTSHDPADDPSRPPDDSKRLAVPNTSVTILDVTPRRKAFQRFIQERTANAATTGDDDRKTTSTAATITTTPTSAKNDNTIADTCNDNNNREGRQIDTDITHLWSTRVVKFLWTDHL